MLPQGFAEARRKRPADAESSRHRALAPGSTRSTPPVPYRGPSRRPSKCAAAASHPERRELGVGDDVRDRDRPRRLHHQSVRSTLERAEDHDQSVALGGQFCEIRFAHGGRLSKSGLSRGQVSAGSRACVCRCRSGPTRRKRLGALGVARASLIAIKREHVARLRGRRACLSTARRSRADRFPTGRRKSKPRALAPGSAARAARTRIPAGPWASAAACRRAALPAPPG